MNGAGLLLGVAVLGGGALLLTKKAQADAIKKNRPYQPSTDIPDALLAKYQQVLVQPDSVSLDGYHQVENELRASGYDYEGDTVERIRVAVWKQ